MTVSLLVEIHSVYHVVLSGGRIMDSQEKIANILKYQGYLFHFLPSSRYNDSRCDIPFAIEVLAESRDSVHLQ